MEQQQLEQMRNELAAMEGSSVPANEPTATENTQRPKTLKELFDELERSPRTKKTPAHDESNPLHSFDEKWDDTHHVCPNCWHRQPIEQDTECELCRAEPKKWIKGTVGLLPKQDGFGNLVDENGKTQQGAYQSAQKDTLNKRWRVWAATIATDKELQEIVAKYSGPWHTWKIKHAASVLRLRGAEVPTTLHGDDPETMPTPMGRW